jgi:branched-chain amino acid transport system ATP-binding protein
MTPPPLLEIDDVSVRFGGLIVLRNVALDVGAGEIMGIIGPNGAGKTTLLNCISGLVKPQHGSIRFGPGRTELTSSTPHARAKLGIGRTFQHSLLFDRLTVLDQLLCGGYSADGHHPVASLLRLPGALRRERALRDHAEELMEKLGLSAYAHSHNDRLPGALRRLVDLGRALMTRPRLLLLDEIAAGTTLDERDRVIRLVQECQREQGVAVVVIEHDLEFVRALAPTIVVLAEGRVISTGETNEALARPEVLEAYVGVAG